MMKLYSLNYTLLSVFALCILFLSCNDEPEPRLPDLRVYLDKFEEEAANRGYIFDLAAVEAEYVDEIQFGEVKYCGYGYTNYEGLGYRKVEIAKDVNCQWGDLGLLQQEAYIFQLIGRAFLGRTNDNTELCDGQPMSIMTNNLLDLFQAYEKPEMRNYYITELLDQSFGSECVDWESGWANDTAYYQYHPHEYWTFEDHDGDFIGLREGDEVLSIELAPGRTASDGGKWFKTIYPNLPECAEVSFKVTLNSEGLTGTGAAVSLRVFERDPMTEFGAPDSYNETLYLTTTDNPVSGQLVNHTEELTIPCLSRKTWFIVLFVRLLPGTEGKISYSDIRLVVN